MKKLKYTLLLLSMGFVVGGSLTGAFSYFSSRAELKQNSFTYINNIGSVEIEESNWDENSAIDLKPNSTIDKNPVVVNNSNYDIYTLIKVEVPVVNAKAIISNDIWKRYIDFDNIESASIDTFKKIPLAVPSKKHTSPNDEDGCEKWDEVTSEVESMSNQLNGSSSTVNYWFIYKNKIAAGEKTDVPAFEELRILNIAEVEAMPNDISMNIKAYSVNASSYNSLEDAKTAMISVYK